MNIAINQLPDGDGVCYVWYFTDDEGTMVGEYSDIFPTRASAMDDAMETMSILKDLGLDEAGKEVDNDI